MYDINIFLYQYKKNTQWSIFLHHIIYICDHVIKTDDGFLHYTSHPNLFPFVKIQ
jgi:hypothetical protein